MSGFTMGRIPLLFNGVRPIGFKQADGTEVFIPILSADGMRLLDKDGNTLSIIPGPSVQKVVPASGDSVQMEDTMRDGTLLVAPAAGISSLTVALPSELNSRLGQVRRIASTKAVTTLNITGATILNTVGSLSAGDCVQFLKIDTNTWTRII